MNVDDFPLITFRPAWTDDDVRFHSDITYLKALRHEITTMAGEIKFANPLPITLSDELTRYEQMVETNFNYFLNMAKQVRW